MDIKKHELLEKIYRVGLGVEQAGASVELTSLSIDIESAMVVAESLVDERNKLLAALGDLYFVGRCGEDSRGWYISTAMGVYYLYTDGVIRSGVRNKDCGSSSAFWSSEDSANTFLNEWKNK
jgi:hypothetical protein